MSNTYDSFDNDAVMAQYYDGFRKFIQTPNEEFYNRRKQASANKAQMKLLRLSPVQFYELTTDVHDEMNRRLTNPPEGDFLPPLESLHPKRNQARKKLYMLQDPRFKDLVFDMLYEIERRKAPSEQLYDPAENDVDGQNQDPTSTGIAAATPSNIPRSNNVELNDDNTQTINGGNEMNRYDSEHTVTQDLGGFNNRPTPPSIVIPNSNINHFNVNPSPDDTSYGNMTMGSLESPLKSPNNTLLQTSMLTPTKSTLVEDTDDDDASEIYDEASFNNPHAHQIEIPRSSSALTSSDMGSHSNEPPSRSVDHNSDYIGTHDGASSSPLYDSQHSHQNNNTGTNGNHMGSGNNDDNIDGFESQLRDKDEQIQLLIGEGTRLDENITMLEQQLAESESLKDTLVEENGHLHEMIVQVELAKDNAIKELEMTKREFTAQSDNYLNEIEGQQRALANLQIQHEQLKEKSQAAAYDRDSPAISATGAAAAGASAMSAAASDSLHSRILALEELLTEKEQQINTLQEELSQEKERTVVLSGTASSSSSLASDHADSDLKARSLIAVAGAAATGAAASSMSRSTSAVNVSQSDPDLMEKYKLMEQELKEHQRMTDKVRSEAAAFLEEMRSLTDSQSSWNSEHATKQIHALKNEIEDWKKRYTQSKAEIRSLRASTYGLNSEALYNGSSYKFADNKTILSEHGLVADVDVAAFQLAVDEFVLASRDTDKSAHQIQFLHSVVQVTKALTQEVAAAPSTELKKLDPDVEQLQREITQATGLVSVTANNLITYTRNFVVAGGMSSLFLLDAAAADLSAAVIELVKLVKVRPTAPPPPPPAKPESPAPQQHTQQKGINHNTNNTNNNKPLPPTGPTNESGGVVVENGEEFVMLPRELPSVNLSSTSLNGKGGNDDDDRLSPGDARSIDFDEFSPSLSNRNRYGSYIREPHSIKFDFKNLADNTVIELQEYLENETAGVIDAIQELLTGIKGTADYHTLRSNITSITDSVRTMIEATSGMMSQSKHWQLKEHGAYIVDSLENCCQRMMVLYGDSAIYDEHAIPKKDFKQRLAGISFDMAKCTTELVKTVEEVNLKREIKDIDEQLQ